MMKRPIKLGIASLRALGVFLALGVVAHAGMPYLPLLGPPPLRMEVVRVPAVKPAVTNALVVSKPEPALPATNLPAVAVAVPVLPDVGPPFTVVPEKPFSDTFSASVFSMPSPDLLGITPQLLVSYFRPIQLGTNFVAGEALPLSFLPPLPPEKPLSSHAEYIVK